MKVVAVMTRVPDTAGATSPMAGEHTGPKTRLAPVLPAAADRQQLQRAMLADVVSAARAVGGVLVRLAVTPAAARPAYLADLGIAPAHVLDQRGDDLGQRERAVFEDLFRRGARQVVIVGSDVPLLRAATIAEAFAVLSADQGQVVLGPAQDGGYYLLGLAGPKVPDLFTGVRWSTKYTLLDTLRRCEFESRPVTFLPLLDDVDEPADLAQLAARLAEDPSAAPHTAAALSALRVDGLTPARDRSRCDS